MQALCQRLLQCCLQSFLVAVAIPSFALLYSIGEIIEPAFVYANASEFRRYASRPAVAVSMCGAAA
eukprot:4404174-Pleurochrysis_carterae.AAC.2